MRCVIRTLLLALLFLAVLAGAGACLFRVAVFRDVDQLNAKWAWWSLHKDDYDSLIIGSSRVRHGLMPSLLDAKTAAAGMPTHTFNFGIDGMLEPEDGYVADFLLESRPRNLRWVFLELSMFADDFGGGDPSTVRTMHWHDFVRTDLCVRAALWPKQKAVKWAKWFTSEGQKMSAAELAWTHLRLFAMRALNVGRGAACVADWLVPRSDAVQLGPKQDGFVPYAMADTLKGKPREEYEKELANYRQNPPRVAPVRAYHQEALETTLRAIRAAGATPVLILAPGLGPVRFQPPAGENVLFFDYYDIAQYPDLFEADLRVDVAHLNPLGAERFTTRFADQFVQAVQTRK